MNIQRPYHAKHSFHYQEQSGYVGRTMTDIHCGLTGKQYNITDQESKDLIDKFRKFTEEYFKSR